MTYKPWFSRSLAADPDRLHFAAHSHHLWPDVTREAHLLAWDDAAALLDHKWGTIFGELIPSVQAHIARWLNLSSPERICFAPNTHEFVVRILSCLPSDRPLRVLTTDAEYHSVRRQLTRLAEEGRADVEWVAAEPFDTFPERFAQSAAAGGHDLVFFSHVHFNSGYVVPGLAELVGAVKDDETFVVIDGYHGFGAITTDLRSIEDRAFYLSGGYKYAMSGEGCCFLAVPPGFGERPLNTGWMASMGTIAARQDDAQVPYSVDGFRFFGATFDPSGLYRLRAVMDLMLSEGVSVAEVHAHVGSLQRYFLDRVVDVANDNLNLEKLVPGAEAPDRGHFLTFRTHRAKSLHDALAVANVVTDYRGDRFRFGFGLYQDESDVDELIQRLGGLNRSV